MSVKGVNMNSVEHYSQREKSFADSFADRAKSIQSAASIAFDDINKLRVKAKKNPYYATARNITILLLYFTVGCASYYALEGWPIGTSVGFTIVSITTIGYGYHTPTSDGARLFTIFYDVFGICFVITIFYKAVQSKLLEFFKRRFFPASDPTDTTHATDVASMYRNNMVLFTWNIVVIILGIILGGIILSVLEDWTFIQGVYFALQTSAVSNECMGCWLFEYRRISIFIFHTSIHTMLQA
ncbi:two pore domain potassium channel family protein [archaeon]|nr:MAG: two pore domain potassium channel family protein [archaeon]